MKKMKIENVQELGQILTAEEMAKVRPAARATKCVCYIKPINYPEKEETVELGGGYSSSDECSMGCKSHCANSTTCSYVVGYNWGYDPDNSGSGSDEDYEPEEGSDEGSGSDTVSTNKHDCHKCLTY